MSDIDVQFEMHAREYELEHRRNDVIRYKRYAYVAHHESDEYHRTHHGKDKPKDYARRIEYLRGRAREATLVHDAVKQDYSKRLRDYTAWKRMLKAKGVT